uniref:Uncharacterized protein n=1 Tax=Siphoviridae sp. ctHip2 TaxID=2827830 RepID=A0A8S5RW70_9CAUD|nr:MAG TPA: hypothetical protein [Siphoviridae sp. ctHip2]
MVLLIIQNLKSKRIETKNYGFTNYPIQYESTILLR